MGAPIAKGRKIDCCQGGPEFRENLLDPPQLVWCVQVRDCHQTGYVCVKQNVLLPAGRESYFFMGLGHLQLTFVSTSSPLK